MSVSMIRRLFDEIVAEAERRPDFARRLAAALADRQTGSAPPGAAPKPRRNRRAPGVVNPFDLFARGDDVLRESLSRLSVEQLKDIVSEHAMDSSKLALKWRAPERLIDLIVTTVRARIQKGEAFKRGFSGAGAGENH
jgi:hypothetical protein